MMYFNNCHNEQEVKTEYRRLSMLLHPDKGGDHYAFVHMHQEYEDALENRKHSKQMPAYFNKNKQYTYFYQPIFYKTTDSHYHIFERQSGCELWIDNEHLNLIFEKTIRI